MNEEPRLPLARERTSIAWARTALGAATLGILMIRFGLHGDAPTEIAGGAAFCVISIPLALTSLTRYRKGAGVAPLALPVVTVAFLLAGVLTLIGVLH